MAPESFFSEFPYVFARSVDSCCIYNTLEDTRRQKQQTKDTRQKGLGVEMIKVIATCKMRKAKDQLPKARQKAYGIRHR